MERPRPLHRAFRKSKMSSFRRRGEHGDPPGWGNIENTNHVELTVTYLSAWRDAEHSAEVLGVRNDQQHVTARLAGNADVESAIRE